LDYKVRDASRISAAEMKYLRITAGYTWTDYKTNTQMAKELKITPNFGQITGIREKLDTTCKQNAS
jgi:biotin synthase-like enzyme